MQQKHNNKATGLRYENITRWAQVGRCQRCTMIIIAQDVTQSDSRHLLGD